MMTLETAQRLTDQMNTWADTTTTKFVLDHSNLPQEAFEQKAREFKGGGRCRGREARASSTGRCAEAGAFTRVAQGGCFRLARPAKCPQDHYGAGPRPTSLEQGRGT